MKKIRHFLNLHELSQSDMHEIVSESNRLKKNVFVPPTPSRPRASRRPSSKRKI